MLSLVISALKLSHNESRLFLGSDGSGCLDEIDIMTTRYWYKRTHYRLLTLFTYLASQVFLLLALFRSVDIPRNTIIYVNTLLPFGAALYGWLTGRAVVYHLHEVSISPTPLRWFLTAIARCTAKRLIYVSHFHRNCLPIRGVKSRVVYNTLDESFFAKAGSINYAHRRNGRFSVLMISSLRDYKGVRELVTLSERLIGCVDIHIDLVVNDDTATIQRYFVTSALPSNLTIYSRTDNPAEHYAKASLVLNLTRTDQWLETFGLTLLEAMAFGVPVIAPPVGGSVELVEDGREGYLIDSRNSDMLAAAVLKLANEESLCLRMSAAARSKAAHFSPTAFAQELREVLSFQYET